MKFIFFLFFFLALSISSFADTFAVDYSGRIKPVEAFDREISFEFCGKPSCLSSKTSLLNLIESGVADSMAIFKIYRAETVEILHLNPAHRTFCYNDFNRIRGLLAQYAERDDSHPLTREFIRLNSSLILYDSLKSQTFINKILIPFSGLSSISIFKIHAESAYLICNLPRLLLFFSAFTFLCIILSFLLKKRIIYEFSRLFVCFIAFATLFLLIWRSLIEWRVPLTSLYELLLVLVFGLSAVASFIAKRFPPLIFIIIVGAISAILLFLETSLSSGDLFAPVSFLLDSPFWLSMHVITIASGFSILILGSIVAHVSLVMRIKENYSKKVENLLYLCLGIGLALSSLGTLLGGFWASIAWGRFWGFDPKENGALLVILWVAIVLHLKSGNLVSERVLETLSSLLSVVIAFCLLGVNLLGVGLHSYGFSTGLFSAFAIFVIVDISVVCLLNFFISRKTKDF